MLRIYAFLSLCAYSALIVIAAVVLFLALLAFTTYPPLLVLRGQCADIAVNISSTIRFPLMYGTECEVQEYRIPYVIFGQAQALELLRLNRDYITAPCDSLLPQELVRTFSDRPSICTAYVTISYSQEDFQLEFNVAFVVMKEQNMSTCIKQYWQGSSKNVMTAPWSSDETVEQVGRAYCEVCKKEEFQTCEPEENGLPCYNCNRNSRSCQWVKFNGTEYSQKIAFERFVGQVTVRGTVGEI